MRLLLDTNVVLMAGLAPERLGGIAEAVRSGEHELWMSPVTVLEMAIKRSTGRLDLDVPAVAYAAEARSRLAARWLDVTAAHAAAVERLPWHHRDPFDRLLVATAQVERLVVATTDATLDRYDVETLLP